MRGEKFIKHVYEILFKCEGKIHGDVHTAHNHASVCSACDGMKHLIWDEHFLSLSLSLSLSLDPLPLNTPTPPHPPPSTVYLPFSLFLSRSLSVTARNHNHKIIKMLFGCH